MWGASDPQWILTAGLPTSDSSIVWTLCPQEQNDSPPIVKIKIQNCLAGNPLSWRPAMAKVQEWHCQKSQILEKMNCEWVVGSMAWTSCYLQIFPDAFPREENDVSLSSTVPQPTILSSHIFSRWSASRFQPSQCGWPPSSTNPMIIKASLGNPNRWGF